MTSSIFSQDLRSGGAAAPRKFSFSGGGASDRVRGQDLGGHDEGGHPQEVRGLRPHRRNLSPLSGSRVGTTTRDPFLTSFGCLKPLLSTRFCLHLTSFRLHLECDAEEN